MCKRAVSFIIFLFLIVLCGGCWDAADIDKKNICTAFVVDKRNGEYTLFAEIANLSAGKNGGNGGGQYSKKDAFSIVSGTGATFPLARADMEKRSDMPFFFATMRALVFTNDMAKEGISEYMNRVREEVDFRKTTFVFTTYDDPEELLSVRTENQISAGNAIESTMQHLADQNSAFKVTVSDALEYLAGHHICFILPNAGIIDGDIAITGYTVMHSGRSIGMIPFEQATGVAYFLTTGTKWVYTVPFGENTATVEVTLKGKEIKPYYENGEIRFEGNFYFDSIVQYINNDIPFDKKSEGEVKSNLHNIILNDIYDTVFQSQCELKCDYLGFDDAFRISYPQTFKKMDWKQAYLEAGFNFKVNLKFNPGGIMDYDPKVKD